MTEAEAVARAQQGHRNYAKRQGTWFRREPEFQWLEGFGDEVEGVALERVREFVLPDGPTARGAVTAPAAEPS
jgi:tRNA dimethylallyltransferase